MNCGCVRLAAAPARLWARLSCTSIRTSIFSSRLDNSAILICFRQKLGREGLPRNQLRKGNEVLWFPHCPPLPPPQMPGNGLQESGGDVKWRLIPPSRPRPPFDVLLCPRPSVSPRGRVLHVHAAWGCGWTGLPLPCSPTVHPGRAGAVSGSFPYPWHPALGLI